LELLEISQSSKRKLPLCTYFREGKCTHLKIAYFHMSAVEKGETAKTKIVNLVMLPIVNLQLLHQKLQSIIISMKPILIQQPNRNSN